MFRLVAPGGAHLLVRRHGAPELALWLPAGLEPLAGQRFGLYLHPHRDYAARLRAAGNLRRGLGIGPPRLTIPRSDAERFAAMLCVYDLLHAGASLRDIAGQLMSSIVSDWRSSSVRSDLRRLADAGTMIAEQGYRALL